MSFTVHTFYNHIHTSWESGASMHDMYHMILKWMQEYRTHDLYPEIEPLVSQWLAAALAGEDTNSLVETFLFAERYRPIHTIFEHFVECYTFQPVS